MTITAEGDVIGPADRYDQDGRPLYCIDGRRHPCPIHWPDEARAAAQARLFDPEARK